MPEKKQEYCGGNDTVKNVVKPTRDKGNLSLYIFVHCIICKKDCQNFLYFHTASDVYCRFVYIFFIYLFFSRRINNHEYSVQFYVTFFSHFYVCIFVHDLHDLLTCLIEVVEGGGDSFVASKGGGCGARCVEERKGIEKPSGVPYWLVRSAL